MSNVRSIAAAFFVFVQLITSPASAEEFRDILASVLGETSPSMNLDQLMYGTPPELTSEDFDRTQSPEANLKRLDEAFVKIKPSDLYNFGQAQQRSPVSTSGIDQKLTAAPLTLVLIPGYLSEFAETAFAEEAFSPSSILAKRWHQLLRDQATNPKTKDHYFSLGENTLVEDSLGAVISVASIDKGNAPLIRLIGFRFPAAQTLESVGTIEDVSTIYRRRLAKVVALLPNDATNLVLVGHSRGAAVALDMLAKGTAASEPWATKVRSVVSYGGVITGASTADRIDILGSIDQETVLINKRLHDSLKTGSNLNPFVLIANLRAYLKYKSANKALSERSTATLNKFFGESDIHDSKYSGMDSVMDKLSEDLDQRGGGGKAFKLKLFISKTLAGLEGLRTSVRLSWFRTNVLPVKGVKYYALASTLTDPQRSSEDEQIVRDAPGIDFESDDFKVSLKSYREMLLEPDTESFDYDLAGGLNDGNVAVQRSVFWPKLIAAVNPRNQLNTEFLGVLAVNHVALAHSKAAPESAPSPFPRAAVLKALAAKVAFDL